MKEDTTYIIAPPGQFNLNLRELWLYRELFYFFTWRDIKVKYKQSVLGFLWAILQPLLMMVIFTFFFARALQLPTDAIPAPLFYFSGLLYWNLFSSGLNTAGNSMVSNADIIKKIYFPRLIIPCSGVLVAFFDFLMAFGIFLLMVLFYELSVPSFEVSWGQLILFTLAAISITVLTSIGAGMLLAALNVLYRDFRYVIPFLIQFLLFVTPVIYPVSITAQLPWIKYLLAVNPMTLAILISRSPFTDVAVLPEVVLIGLCAMLVLFSLGIFVFKKMEAYFADIA